MHRAARTLCHALIAAGLAACSGNSSGPSAGFECLGQALPTTAPATVTVTGQVKQNALSPNALGGAYIFAFRTGDTTTRAADTSNTPGFYSLTITTGGTPVDGYVRATDSAHITTYAYPPVPLAADAIENLDPATFPVSWQELPALRTIDEALAPGASLIHPNRPENVLTRGRVMRGDVTKALAEADAIVEAEFETGFVEHACIEPEAGLARRVGDQIEIQACTQSPYMDRSDIAKLLGIPAEAVRIIPTAVGGGFGDSVLVGQRVGSELPEPGEKQLENRRTVGPVVADRKIDGWRFALQRPADDGPGQQVPRIGGHQRQPAGGRNQ